MSAALVVSVSGVTSRAKGFDAKAWARPGKQPNGSILLMNGRSLTPAGTQTELEPLPLNAVLSPDGSRVLVSDDARNTQYLQAVSVATGRTVQRIAYPLPHGLFYGLAYTRDGREAFASGGAENVVHAFWVYRSGYLKPSGDIPLAGPGNFNPFASGVALIDHDKLLLAAEVHTDNVAIIEVASHQVIGQIAVGNSPYGVVATGTNTAMVSDWGSGTVSAISVPAYCEPPSCRGTVVKTMRVGAHPNAVLAAGSTVYVANADSDSVSVISIPKLTVTAVISVRLGVRKLQGSSPEGLAVDRSDHILYVATSGDNAVVVVQLAQGGASGQVIGRIPVGEYPTSVVLTLRPKRMWVTNALGYGSTPNAKLPLHDPTVISAIMSEITIPTADYLLKETSLVKSDDNVANAVLTGRPPNSPVPLAGHSSPIKHVIYILKENQTYDQVLGDIRGADGDSKLARWGESVTPNLHALARRFGILDNFYDDGQATSDGHNWAMSANDDDFNEKMWPESYGWRSQFGVAPGASLMDYSPGGYLWDAADRAGVSYRDYGEFYVPPDMSAKLIPAGKSNRCSGPVAHSYIGRIIPTGNVLCLQPSWTQPGAYTLTGHHDFRYRGLDMRYSDLDREAEWFREFKSFVGHDDMPSLEVIWLPNDHTAAGPDFLSPSEYVRQNDLAIGRLVEAVSHSRYWKSTAIFITEDDPQGARDHVNAQRTEALVISPYTQTTQPQVRSELWDNSSMLRTIELILGLEPMSEFDGTAVPMWAVFQSKPDLTPFSAIETAAITGSAR